MGDSTSLEIAHWLINETRKEGNLPKAKDYSDLQYFIRDNWEEGEEGGKWLDEMLKEK